MREFLNGGKPEVVRYAKCLPPDEVVERAMSRIGEEEYDLVFNNCEHFARWCKTGDRKSEQVKDAAAVAGATTAGAASAAVSIAAVSACGAVEGLSGAGIVSGLAAIGPGGVLGGVGTLAVAPGLAANIAADKILEDDESLDESERCARAVGRTAAKAGTLAGAAGTVAAISSAGTAAGLSGAGLTSGLAAIGGTVGGGMVAGTVIAATAPAVATLAAGIGIYRLVKWFSD